MLQVLALLVIHQPVLQLDNLALVYPGVGARVPVAYAPASKNTKNM